MRTVFRRFRIAATAVASMLFVAWLVGQIVRDATWFTGLCFYIPSAILVIVLVVGAVVSAFGRRKWTTLFAMAFAVPPLAVVAWIENHADRAPAGAIGELRLVHWNTGGRPGRPGIVEYLVAERADLYVLTDVPSAAHLGVFCDQLGPGYQSAMFANLAVVGRGEIRADGWLIERDGFVVQAVTWVPAERPIHLFVINLPSDIRVARDPLLREVNSLILRDQPDLVVGDFNAPRRSKALTELPAGYSHAYHTAGGGWGSTWPVPVPVYALDHCLHGPRIVPVLYRLGGLRGDSDHRYQAFDFSLVP